MIPPRMAAVTTALAILAAGLGCCSEPSDGNLRGAVSDSVDGKTYLAIVDDNGGLCGPMIVDGEAWPYAIGQPGPVPPGRHTLGCGRPDEMSFVIPEGKLFEFDYWGP